MPRVVTSKHRLKDTSVQLTVIRDHSGIAIAAGACSANFLMCAQHAEAVACLKGLECADGLGMRRIILETDAAFVAKALSDPGVDRSILGTLLGEIKALIYDEFSECIISRVFRGCNAVADTLAAMSLNCMHERTFVVARPSTGLCSFASVWRYARNT
jgi:hypothetical protein